MPSVNIKWDCDCCGNFTDSVNMETATINQDDQAYMVCNACIESGFECIDCKCFVEEVISPIQVIFKRCIPCQAKFRFDKK